MEFGSRKARKRREIEAEVSYPSGLQLYTDPPTGDISLVEFDEMAFERLKVLRTVERWNLSGHIKNSEEWITKLYEDFGKNKFFIITAEKNPRGRSDEVQKARRQDHASHFIMRLAYCRTEELRRWFITHETGLFKARFINASKGSADVKAFLSSNNLQFTPITPEEKEQERENLMDSSMGVTGDSVDGMSFYKVPFMDALDLVRQRKVFLKQGFAYVPETDMVTLVCNSFRSNLSKAMINTCRALPQLDSDERIVSLLQDFDRRYTGKDYSSRKPEDMCHITPDMIDTLAPKSFPPCMRHLNDTLRADHHLKYNGRLIYGLFLKAAGLKLEDALHFWRSHFLQNMDVDKFEKRYAYSIRYNYGKEGKKTDFSPYGCLKIIMGSVGAGDTHGCTFKHTEPNILKQRLTAYNVTKPVTEEIMDLVNKRHYQIACQRYWEAMHGAPIDAGINHPNQFFEESQKFLNGDAKPGQVTKRPEVKTTTSVMYSSQASSSTSTQATQATQAMAVEDAPMDPDLDDILKTTLMRPWLSNPWKWMNDNKGSLMCTSEGVVLFNMLFISYSLRKLCILSSCCNGYREFRTQVDSYPALLVILYTDFEFFRTYLVSIRNSSN
ncbi:DNA primase large subunit [Chionoecetes opilio]|uniref:DNA primase large subunit n=1 Tax=Chionoecetes opilio TaxID=41210 RepID=A0A8J4YM84_CHIOP|nr:DNA primase large subunit [Chionoecetes opilio]